MSARREEQAHLALGSLWLLLAVPTILWWRDSIPWLAFMSLYANVAGHWAAWQAARAERRQAGDTAPSQ